jgi:hypothetical protein
MEEEEAITEEDDDDDHNSNNNNSLPAPILKLRIRNTTKYLNWHQNSNRSKADSALY